MISLPCIIITSSSNTQQTFLMRLGAVEIRLTKAHRQWHIVMRCLPQALIWCRGRVWGLCRGHGRQNAASIQRERAEGSVCVSNFGVCVGRGEGVWKLWFTLKTPPIEVVAASRAGQLGSSSYVFIWLEILDSKSFWLPARPQSPLR